ncbi:GyrI-like domain-containing protein [Bacillus sp. RO3]|nr:GyrI-like domain-containing protein [Bacillus sp. RO3]
MNEGSVKELTELKLIGYRVLCAGERYAEEIPKAAIRLKEREGEIKHVLHPGRQIGAFIVEAPSSEEDGYWIGVQVREYEDTPDNMTTLTIPPQRYASILHRGPNHQIRERYEELHRWIEEEGYTRSHESWNLEIYEKENDPEHPGDMRVELYDSIVG